MTIIIEWVSKREYQELPSDVKPITLASHLPWEIKLAKEKQNYNNICLCSHLQNNSQAANSKGVRKTKFQSKNTHTQKFLLS